MDTAQHVGAEGLDGSLLFVTCFTSTLRLLGSCCLLCLHPWEGQAVGAGDPDWILGTRICALTRSELYHYTQLANSLQSWNSFLASLL